MTTGLRSERRERQNRERRGKQSAPSRSDLNVEFSFYFAVHDWLDDAPRPTRTPALKSSAVCCVFSRVCCPHRLQHYTLPLSMMIRSSSFAVIKVPIETLPVELRIKIYELGDVSSISLYYDFPWSRTILMSGILNDKDAIEIAAIQGDEPRRIMCNYIAYSGNIPMMKWARSDKSSLKLHDDAVDDRSMKQIRLTPFPWDAVTCRIATFSGHYKLLKWLHEQGCPWDEWTFCFAVENGSMEMLEWLYENKCPWDSYSTHGAAESGNFDVLKWLRERKCPWDEDTFYAAIHSGNLDMVQWLHEQGCPFNSDTCSVAASSGNLDMVQRLHEQGCPFDSDTCSAAAWYGQLEILKWLHERGCPWDSRACANAARNGHLETLKWLREQGCPG